MNFKARLKQNLRPGMIGAVITVLCGLALGFGDLGGLLSRLSYDIPFVFGPVEQPDEVVIINMDEESHRILEQVYGTIWNRSLHAQLLRRLTEDKCRLVVFDVFLAAPGPEKADAELAEAMKANGKVLLAADLSSREKHSEKDTGHIQAVIRPWSKFLAAATNWGLSLVEWDRDLAIREHYAGTESDPGLAWAAAELAGAEVTLDPAARLKKRWMRYYGRKGTIRSVSYVDAPKMPAGYFFNKFVFIGGKPRTLFVGDQVDEFRTPYTRRHAELTAGVEINATTFLNLWRGDWITRASPLAQFLFFLTTGLLLGFGLTLVRPMAGAGISLMFVLVLGSVAVVVFWKSQVWFSWVVMAGAQVPCALGWAVLAHTMGLRRHVKELEEKIATSSAPTSHARTVPLENEPRSLPGTPSIPDHTLLRCIGKGAYGQVWLCRNAVGIYRAVKIVSRHEFNKPEPFEREFKGIRKFMPISLDHPGLVRVLHVGPERHAEAQYFYYIMELGDDEVTGHEIDPAKYSPKNLARELARRGRIPLDECLDLFLSLSDALEFLHKQRLIHRDIKPSNIIYLSGMPKFADIGLVTDIGSADQEVTYIGTTGYIAPEGPGAPSADVYSLGKVLYEAGFGLDRKHFPELPTTLIEKANDLNLFKLNHIVLKACEADPRRRYQSAAELHADLLQLQRGLTSAHKA